MSTTGKLLRLSRFRYPNSKAGLLVPIDHGLTVGPLDGLASVSRIGSWIGHDAVTGIVAHKGMLERLVQRGVIGKIGVMVHVNGMSTLAARPDRKEVVTTIESAVRLGCDGLSLQLNFNEDNDAHNITLLGSLVDRAQEYGLPVLVMVYDKIASENAEARIPRLRHLIRIAIELGADAIKIGAPSNAEELPALLDGLSEDIAVFIAGGPLCAEETLLDLARRARRHGASGLCVGRNVFQRAVADPVLTALRRTLNETDHRGGQTGLDQRGAGLVALQVGADR